MTAIYHRAGYRKADNLLDLKTLVSIVWRSAEGLAYTHQQNVVLRDIKPADIMYDSDMDSVKITNFGIWRITDLSKTETEMILGTPSYMSPEQREQLAGYVEKGYRTGNKMTTHPKPVFTELS